MGEDRTKVQISEMRDFELSGTVIAHADEIGDKAWHGKPLSLVYDGLEGRDVLLDDEVVGKVVGTDYDWHEGVVITAEIDPQISSGFRDGRLRLEATVRTENELTKRCDGMDWVRHPDDIIGFGDLHINEESRQPARD